MQVSDFFNVLWKISSRYFILAGIAFLLLYVFFKKKIAHKKIQQRFPADKDYWREIGYSILTMLIFGGIVFTLLMVPAVKRHTTFYTSIHQHGWLYFWLAFPIMFFMHDAYFYITHRLMHHKKVFRLLHLVHHKSTNPSPWAALCISSAGSIGGGRHIRHFPLYHSHTSIAYWAVLFIYDCL